MYRWFFLASCAWAAIVPLKAQVKYSNEFLTLGVGARAQGMGTAVTSLTDDVTAGYWNPAGLASINAPLQLGAMHAEWFAGIAQFDFVGFAKQLNPDIGAVFSVNFIRLGIDNIPYTITLVNTDGSINYNNLSEFSAADYAGIVSYGQRLRNSHWQIGGSTKIIHRVVGSFGSAWGFGADAGAMYIRDTWRVAMMAHDLTTTFNAWTFTLSPEEKAVFEDTDNAIPVSSIEVTRPRISLAAAKQFKLNAKWNILTACDVDMTTDGKRNTLLRTAIVSLDPKFGVELNYANKLFLRSGMRNIQSSTDNTNGTKTIWTFQPDMGLGIKFGRLKIDYAFTNIGNLSQTLYSHIVSLSFNIVPHKK